MRGMHCTRAITLAYVFVELLPLLILSFKLCPVHSKKTSEPIYFKLGVYGACNVCRSAVHKVYNLSIVMFELLRFADFLFQTMSGA